MLRLYHVATRLNGKINRTISEFFLRFDSDSLQLNLVICMRRMLRLKPDTTQFNEKNHRPISEFFPRLDFRFIAIEFGYLHRKKGNKVSIGGVYSGY